MNFLSNFNIKDKCRNYIVFFVIFIFFIINIYVWSKLSFYCAFTSDNLSFSLYEENEKFFDCLLSLDRRHGGGFFAFFLTKTFSSGLSKLLGIHLSDFIGTPHGYIKGFLFSIMIFTFSWYSLLFQKSKRILCLIFLFLSLFSYYGIYFIRAEVLYFDNNMFYRFFFPLIFYPMYFTLIYKSIINPRIVLNYKYLITLCVIYSLVLGTHAETIPIQLIIFHFLIIFYNFVLYYCLKFNKKIRGFYYSLNRIFYIALLSVSVFFISFMFLPGTVSLYNTRIGYKINYLLSLNDYIYGCFQNRLTLNIIFMFVFIIALYISIKRKEINKIIYILFIYLSLHLSMLSLMFSQNEGIVYVLDVRLMFIFKFLLMYVILLTISYILKHVKYRKLCINLFCIFLMLLSSVYIVALYNNFDIFKSHSYTYYLEKEKNYINEKIFRFYDLKNQMAYLDNVYLTVSNENCNLWMPDIVSDDCISPHNIDIRNYYSFVYKIPSYSVACYCNDAIYKFYEAGGYFTKEELDNLSFKNLYDEDFVLNAKGTKLSADEIFDIMKTPVQKY